MEKVDVYNEINRKNYLRFELSEDNEKEYLEKLISVREALKDVERKNDEEYEQKILKLDSLKNGVKEFYNNCNDLNNAKQELEIEFDNYLNQYLKPLEQLLTRREKLQVQVVPYITNGFWQRFKALFTYEGRAKLKIEKEFNKELKSVEKDIKEAFAQKQNHPLSFEQKDDMAYQKILENIDVNVINENQVLTKEQKDEFKSSLNISKNYVIKKCKIALLDNISEYVEVCSDYNQIADLNIEEQYRFKNSQYKIYLQFGYLDNDLNSVSKYLEIAKSEKDFVGKQATNKLIDGIGECIEKLQEIVSTDEEDLKLA